TVAKVGLLVSVAANGSLPRYGTARDEDRGGDDWATPSMNRFAHDFPTLRWNDFSNLNAGSFSPDHRSHQRGIDADVQFADGFQGLDPINGCFASAEENVQMARRFLDLLNDIVHGQEIKTIWVTCKDKTNPFWTTLQGQTVLGNRDATTVVRHLK